MTQDDVKLFALSTCIHCRNTRQFLSDNHVAYDCVEVDKLTGEERQKTIEEIRKYNPSVSFPTLVVGDKVIVGFKKDDILRILGLE